LITKKLLVLLILTIILLAPSLTITHAFYVGSIPSNTIFADDFESQTTTTCTGAGSQQAGCLSGYAQLDVDTGGKIGVNNTNYYSCCHSLYLQSSTANAGKFDVDKRVGLLSNTTRYITLSVWFAYASVSGATGTTTNNAGGANYHIAIETWTTTTHYECLLFLYWKQVSSGSVQPDFVTATGGGGTSGSVDHTFVYNLEPWDATNVANKAWWHHIVITCDVSGLQWIYAEIDGISFPSIKGLGMRTIADTSQQSYTPPLNVRVEFATQNAATHATPTDNFWGWYDDMLVTDTTPGGPPVIQFGISIASGLFIVIMVATAMMYSTSGLGTVMRVFGNGKGPKFLVDPKVIIISGVVGTVGFLFMIIIGTWLVQPACPAGFICTG